VTLTAITLDKNVNLKTKRRHGKNVVQTANHLLFKTEAKIL
jgi:hypothetical protein